MLRLFGATEVRPDLNIHVAALPPDVRKWLCPFVETVLTWGLRPGHSPIREGRLAAWQSRRRTSGGTAISRNLGDTED